MLRVTLWWAMALGVSSALAGERVFDFSKYPVDKTPPGFRSVLAGEGPLGEWKVILDRSGPGGTTNSNTPAGQPVLAQLSRETTDEHFPMLMFEEETYGDFTLTTRFKLVDGRVEQMGGIAFRMQDTNNYYYIRASGLGKTFKFFKLVNGQRSVSTVGASNEITRGVWHELAVECKGSWIRCLLNGQELFPSMQDSSFSAGKIAFWTKSDSVTYFGETRIRYTPRETLAQVLVRETVQRYPRLVGLKIYSLQGEERTPKIVASNEAGDLGRPGDKVEQDVILRDVSYHGKERGISIVTLPLHDRNGEVAGAVRILMQSFPGQTEQNALARGLPIVKEMEKRIRTARELTQ